MGKISHRLGICTGITLLLWSLSVQPAVAKKRAVVLPFTGSSGAKVRAAYIRAIKKRFKIIPSRSYYKIAKRLRVKANSKSGRVAVCRKLKCHAVVTGSVKRAKRRYSVSITVFNGANGKVIGSRAKRVRSRRHVTRTGASLGKQSIRFIAKGSIPSRRKSIAKKPPKPVSPPPPQPPPEKMDTSDIPGFEDEQPPGLEVDLLGEGTKKKKKDTVSLEEDNEGEPKKLKGLFNARVGVSFMNRNLTIDGDKIYEGGFPPAIHIGAEIYPMVFLNNFARNFGIGFSYLRHLSASTTWPDPSGGADRKLKTGFQSLLLDVLFRWQFMKNSFAPTLKVNLGWGFRDFDLDKNDLLTSMSYQYIHIALGGSFLFSTPYIGFFAQVDLRPVLKIEQEAIDSYGVKNKSFGVGLTSGLFGNIAWGMFWYAALDFLQYSTSFDGLTASGFTERLDFPTDRADPSKAKDRFLRIGVGLGYEF